EVDVGVAVALADREPQAAKRSFPRITEGKDDMARLERPGGAGRSRRRGDALPVELEQERLALDPLEEKAGVVGKPPNRGPRDFRSGDPIEHAPEEAIAKGGQVGDVEIGRAHV